MKWFFDFNTGKLYLFYICRLAEAWAALETWGGGEVREGFQL